MREHQAEALAVGLLEESAKDALAVWQTGYDAYAAYLSALAEASGPGDILTANAELLAAYLNLFGSAAGSILQTAGLREPVLSDA